MFQHRERQLVKSTCKIIYPPDVLFGLCFRFMVFNATFNNISVITYIVAVSFIGGGNRSTQRNSQTCPKSLTNFIT